MATMGPALSECGENETLDTDCGDSICNIEYIDDECIGSNPSCHCKEGYRRAYGYRDVINGVHVDKAPCILEEDCGEQGDSTVWGNKGKTWHLIFHKKI